MQNLKRTWADRWTWQQQVFWTLQLRQAARKAQYLKDEGHNNFTQTSAMPALWFSQRRLGTLLSSCIWRRAINLTRHLLTPPPSSLRLFHHSKKFFLSLVFDSTGSHFTEPMVYEVAFHRCTFSPPAVLSPVAFKQKPMKRPTGFSNSGLAKFNPQKGHTIRTVLAWGQHLRVHISGAGGGGELTRMPLFANNKLR
jgi:hypothetical protein